MTAILGISYMTRLYGSPEHMVSVRMDQRGGWDVDQPMTATEANGETTWSLELDVQIEYGQNPHFVFKLLLDGHRWMDDPNREGTAAIPPIWMAFDDVHVAWQQ